MDSLPHKVSLLQLAAEDDTVPHQRKVIEMFLAKFYGADQPRRRAKKILDKGNDERKDKKEKVKEETKDKDDERNKAVDEGSNRPTTGSRTPKSQDTTAPRREQTPAAAAAATRETTQQETPHDQGSGSDLLRQLVREIQSFIREEVSKALGGQPSMAERVRRARGRLETSGEQSAYTEDDIMKLLKGATMRDEP
ncbi:unnamed protein product [Vitrella brassicaformis CCMP3155]|uniref:Uncharacterized protein n=1 Tax=Vitrella brassicaformis (strain CCMP3155) TaxID=1169540 RepID=A0A0G4GXQ9_VITBC|nr:unnamed protein product [Vitrella brassicaformis CCMP3155]|eukprot:CEM35895.1 unnamed protein product [Vitrella brassicaformis CCMP3155]